MEKRQSTNANDLTQILELFDKNLKATITETLQEVRGVYTLATNGKIESFSKEKENIRKNKMKIVELKIQ